MTANPEAALTTAGLLESGWLRAHLAPWLLPEFQVQEWKAQGVAYYYRASDANGSYFVRVYEQDGGPLEQALLNHLRRAGASVCPILQTTSARHPSSGAQLRIDLKPFIPAARGYDNSEADFQEIAISLKAIHDALALVPEAGIVKQAAIRRAQQHASTVRRIGEINRNNQWKEFPHLEIWARENMGWLDKFCEEFNPEIHALPQAQVLHGDVHPGNVLWGSEGVVFIDFEHSGYTYAPREWDLAYLFQRFVLQAGGPRENWAQRRRLVEELYQIDLTNLPEFMSLASRLCAAILFTDLLERNIEIPLPELSKFVQLEHKTAVLKKSLW